MKRFQQITSGHLGTPFGAGYGDQGKFSLAEFVAGSETSVPAEIPVRYEVQPLQKLLSGAAGSRGRRAAGRVFWILMATARRICFWWGGRREEPVAAQFGRDAV